jgi:serine/threonine protein kinase
VSKKKSSVPAPTEVLFSAGGVTYEFIQELGAGPRGERLLLARARGPGHSAEQVILKSIPAQAEGRARRRLEEEARLATLLSHPGIARLYALHEHQSTLYAVMEYVQGDCVDSVFNDALLCGRYCSEPLVLWVAAEVASALHHAHTLTDARGVPLGIIHRGLHPQRIRLGPRGEVKLTDFGLARALLPGRETSSLPRLGGRGVYSSPEQILRQRMDGRSDLFALGLVMLELLTGQHLLWPLEDVDLRQLGTQLTTLPAATLAAVEDFVEQMGRRQPALVRGELAQLTHRASNLGFEDVEQVARELTEPTRFILHKLLRREPSQRYATAAELERALRERLRVLGHRGAPEVAEEAFQLKAEAAGFMPERMETTGSTLEPDQISTQ